MDQDEVALETALELYDEGVQLLRRAEGILGRARERIAQAMAAQSDGGRASRG